MVDLSLLLNQTSRTFAIAIPLLPEPTRLQVTIAYLLFRTADTFEDATEWPREKRLAALQSFQEVLLDPNPEAAAEMCRGWLEAPPTTHSGYLNLLRSFPELLRASIGLSEPGRMWIYAHAIKTAAAMSGFVRRTDKNDELRLSDLADLRHYCYAVAGIVGEMLTELFLLATPVSRTATDQLRARATRFGEGLQLVNILKDAHTDAKDKRFFLPDNIAFQDVIELARADLLIAQEYIDCLRDGGAHPGVIRFTALPVLLAEETLAGIEAHGSGTKISRADVARIGSHVHQAVASGGRIWSLAGGMR